MIYYVPAQCCCTTEIIQ